MTAATDTRLALVLDGRQAWYENKLRHVAVHASASWLELGLNVPGWPKRTSWSAAVFAEGCRQLGAVCAGQLVTQMDNEAGRFSLFASPLAPQIAKARAVHLEQRHPWGRLWDMDCRGPDGVVTRRSLALPERRCLVCELPHERCIGSGRHALREVRECAATIAARPLVDERPQFDDLTT